MASNLRVWAGLALAPSAMLIVMLTAACSTAEKPRPVVPPPSLVQSPGKSSIAVSDDQAGASIVLEPAQELVVSLAVSATAGVEWSLIDLKPGVLAVASAKFERAARSASDSEAVGAMVWRFKPEAGGTVALNFDLRRPRSLVPALRTVTYAVTVK